MSKKILNLFSNNLQNTNMERKINETGHSKNIANFNAVYQILVEMGFV